MSTVSFYQVRKLYFLAFIVIFLILVLSIFFLYPAKNPYGCIKNGGFEIGDLDGWDLFGDPNVGEKHKPYPTIWCDLRNESCKVEAMGIVMTNQSVYKDKWSAMLAYHAGIFGGHYAEDQAKLDLRQNITLPNKEAILSLVTRAIVPGMLPEYKETCITHGGGPLIAYHIIIYHDGDEEEIWRLDDCKSDLIFNWTPLNFSLAKYSGQNITIIFRFKQEIPTEAVGAEARMWFIDEVKIVEKEYFRTDVDWKIDRNLVDKIEKEAENKNMSSSIIVENILREYLSK